MIDPKRRAEIEELLKTASDADYDRNSTKWAIELGILLEALGELRRQKLKEQREEDLAKDLGAEPEPTAVLGYESREQVLTVIDALEEDVDKDITFPKISEGYMDAAIALLFFDAAAFGRLVAKLKSKGMTSAAEWASNIKRALRQEKEKLKAAGSSIPGIGPGGRPSQATAIVGLIRNRINLFHDSEKEGFVEIPVGSHTEVHKLRSTSFRRWVEKTYLDQVQSVPNAEAVRAAINTLEGVAMYDSPEFPVYLRLAGIRDADGNLTAVYLDLGDPDWRVVEVTSAGWRVLAKGNPAIKFWRSPSTFSLQEPVSGGDLSELWGLLNIPDQGDRDCYLACLLSLLWPDGDMYPIFEIKGGYGSTKTTCQEFGRSLVDPNKVLLRRPPTQSQDLAIAALNNWLISYNNLSSMPKWLSNDLCCLVEGLGFATRTLYENTEETIFAFKRPVWVNGIEDFISEADLANRVLTVRLPRIRKGKHRSKSEMKVRFEAAAPRVLGCLLDLVSAALRNLPDLQKTNLPLPRLADFCKWVIAAGMKLDWKPERFLEVYASHTNSGGGTVLEHPVVTGILKMKSELPWTGTATDLHIRMGILVTESVTKMNQWPKGPNALTNKLRVLTGDLEEAFGITVEFNENALPRELTIRLVNGGDAAPAETKDQSPPAQPPQVGPLKKSLTPVKERKTSSGPSDRQTREKDEETPWFLPVKNPMVQASLIVDVPERPSEDQGSDDPREDADDPGRDDRLKKPQQNQGLRRSDGPDDDLTNFIRSTQKKRGDKQKAKTTASNGLDNLSPEARAEADRLTEQGKKVF